MKHRTDIDTVIELDPKGGFETRYDPGTALSRRINPYGGTSLSTPLSNTRLMVLDSELPDQHLRDGDSGFDPGSLVTSGSRYCHSYRCAGGHAHGAVCRNCRQSEYPEPMLPVRGELDGMDTVTL